MSTNKTSPPDAREWGPGMSSYCWTREPPNFRGKKDCVIPSGLPETSLGGCGRDLAILWDMSLESPTRHLNESRMTHSRDCFSHRQWDPSSPPAGLQPHTAALRAMAPWRPTLSTDPQGPDVWPKKDNSLLKQPNRENAEYLYVMAQVHLTTDVKVCCPGHQPRKCPQNTPGSLYMSPEFFFFFLAQHLSLLY